jgi:hypothetical protein
MARNGGITHRELTAPTKKPKPFNDPGWVWELKHDGELLGYFPEIAEDLRKLPDIVIDGELVMMNEQGKPEFHQPGVGAQYAIRRKLHQPRSQSQRDVDDLSLRAACLALCRKDAWRPLQVYG